MREKTIYMLSILVFLLGSLLTACSKQEDAQTQKQPPAPSTEPVTSEISQPSGMESTVQTTEQPTPEPAQAITDQEKTESPVEMQQPSVQTAEKTPVVDQSKLALARKSGCLSCHAVNKKIVGPAWRDVAKRYKDVPDAKTTLITKVSKGGRGNWTEVVGTAAMPPYSPRVSDENIAQLVEFVLSLE